MTENKIPPPRGRPKTLNKNDVVKVAMNAYLQQGPAEVSLNEVCRRAGVSKPSLYREFGNEDGLVCAVLENYVQCVMVKVIENLAREGSFTDKIGRIVYLATEDAQHENGCLFVKMRAVKSGLGEKTQATIAQTESMALEAYALFLNESRENGDWSGCIPVALGAQYLHAQIGLAMAQRARGDDPKAILELALSIFKTVNR
jgi:AcrR family transcriptional regulator